MEEEAPSPPDTPPAPQQRRDIMADSEMQEVFVQVMVEQAPTEAMAESPITEIEEASPPPPRSPKSEIHEEQNAAAMEESMIETADLVLAEGEGRRREESPSSARVSEEESQALRLKSLAEAKYRSKEGLKSALRYAKRAIRLAPDLDGLPQMVTALRVLRAPSGDHYRALLVEPFSHVNTVRRQYKALALVLHPDKNAASLSTFPGSEEAFKRISEAFQILSDRVRRTEYDTKLRMELEVLSASSQPIETFWTACTICRLFHQFDRKYLGQRLLCPRCRKSFLAVEVSIDGSEEARIQGGCVATSSTSKMVTRTRSGRIAGVISRSLIPSRVQVKQEISSGKKRKVSFADSSEESTPKKPKEKTLAEIQTEITRKSRAKTGSSRRKEKVTKIGILMPCKKRVRDSAAMAVEDSDFYDFDKQRSEKSFKKGQIWAIYDDDDGMPRHYGLIHEVCSTIPFKLTMIWLDLQTSNDQALHISSGEFKFGKQVAIDSVNLFSHQMESERATKEIYRIYPRKGSVWALYKEESLHGVRGYDIVVLLSSFSEDYGLTMAYLEKVEGFRSIFKRREIGAHAIRWLEKIESHIFSHQIPARKIKEEEIHGVPGDCWELDPASLPPDLLQIGWKKR